jgi:hypothetical protein
VRNRESAAASRQRIRSRIDELELEVEDWKNKYRNSVLRLRELDQLSASAAADAGGAAADSADEI